MKAKKIIQGIIFIFTLLLINFSCKKEDKTFEDLVLKVEKVGGDYNCSWNESTSTFFNGYSLIISDVPIPNDLNEIEEFTVRTISIDSQAVNNHQFKFYVPQKEVYIQLRMHLDLNTIYSNTVFIENINTVKLDLSYPKYIGHEPDKNLLYLSNNSQNKINTYNYETREIKEFDFDPTIYGEAIIANNGSGNELYVKGNNNDLLILDANTFEIKETYEASSSIQDITSNEDGLIILKLSTWNNPIRIINRDGMNLINGLSVSTSGNFGLGMLSKDENRFVLISNSDLISYQINENGELLNSFSVENTFVSVAQNYRPTVSPMGQYIINSEFGEVYDSNLNFISRLFEITDYRYNSYTFNEDETILYGAVKDYDPIAGYQLIHKFSVPDFTLLETYSSISLEPQRIIIHQDQLLILAKRLNSPESYILSIDEFSNF